ncbi:MAG: energy transducer TonB [Nitrospinae bacterium]|nr:energy transducer TonB [Nitrospinota bacterium]MBF0634512.1 energy transducer TonB [Nitrospinota bacterium]
MTDRRSVWLTSLFVSLILNGLFLWIVQALTLFEAPREMKEYFPIELVRLDTPPLEILQPQLEKPVSRPSPVPLKPKSESVQPVVNRNSSQEAPPQEVPVAEDVRYEENAPQSAEPMAEAPATTVSVNETPSGGGTANQTGGEPGDSGNAFVPINRLTRIPTFAKKVEPVYPENERLIGKETVVLAEIDLDEKGSIIEIRIINSGGKPFDSAVENALRKSQLTPGYVKDKAVPIRVQIPFAFKLK